MIKSAVARQTAQRLLSILPSLRNKQVLLVGDVVADHYIFGNSSRISREAPVLILRFRQETVIPGQAGNTAANIAALGGKVALVGVVGRDTRGSQLRASLKERGVDVRSLLTLSGVSTLTKTRILAGGHHAARQQVIRIDDDERLNLDSQVTQQVCDSMRKLASCANVIVVSDYGYGLINETVWELAVQLKKEHDIPLVLDSRFNLNLRKGATIITPNEEEAVACIGRTVDDDYDLLKIGPRLLKTTSAENVLITRGNEGMILFQPKRKPVEIPIVGSDECTDVTGAGDTVAATISLALSGGAEPEDAARLANIAAGVVVMKIGTATVTPQEIKTALTVFLNEESPALED